MNNLNKQNMRLNELKQDVKKHPDIIDCSFKENYRNISQKY